MPQPKPSKPFRGWAVFNEKNRLIHWTISYTRTGAWTLYETSTGIPRENRKHAGYSVRRIVVAEPSEGGT